jgi:phosphoserine aminotransferase
MQRAQAEFLEFAETQTSVMEISHRGKDFLKVYNNAVRLLREIMDISDDYAVLFLSGGATGQSAAIPLNLTASSDDTTAYIISGHWSQRSAVEGKKYCHTHIAADNTGNGHTILPSEWDVPENAAYLHYADNETVHGVEFSTRPDSFVPLVADMSSNIASRRINVSDYGLIYAGAQKNLGPTGVTVVIVRKELIRARSDVPMIWDYKNQIPAESMLNTPPTFQIYMVSLVLEWVKNEGGIDEMEKRCVEKAKLLYSCIDAGNFYTAPAQIGNRSRTSIPFFLADDVLTGDFVAGAEKEGMIGLKGHALLGGCRACMYNSMSVAGAQQLVEYMREFERKHG